jgi:putative endonuclease
MANNNTRICVILIPEFMYFSITMPERVPNYSQIAGDAGEEAAARFLARNGYKIRERNWRYRKFEIDIIAETADTIVFVEVKARGTNDFGEPETFVTRKKQGFIVSAAHFYITDRDIEKEARFDVISVYHSPEGLSVNHLPDAFRPLAK